MDKRVIVVGGILAVAGAALLGRQAGQAGGGDNLGDLNNDGSVDALDITELERYIAGFPPDLNGITIEEFERRADVNGDGYINSLDIVALERIVIGL